MNKHLIENLTNPTKNRLLLEIASQGQATTKELAAKYPDIAQATLYRYLKKMTEQGVLTVIEERQVRNVTEKIYALAVDLEGEIEKMIAGNDGAAYFQLFQQFSAGLMGEFKNYAERDAIDIAHDGSGFRVTPIYASLDELKELSASIQELIKPYREREASPAHKARSVAVIITPPTD